MGFQKWKGVDIEKGLISGKYGIQKKKWIIITFRVLSLGSNGGALNEDVSTIEELLNQRSLGERSVKSRNEADENLDLAGELYDIGGFR